MQTTPRYGLTALIAILGLVALFTGWVLTLILPGIRSFAWGILALGVLLLATAFIIDFRRVGRALASRRGKFGISTTMMVSIFIGIILLVNAISIGSYHRFDFTGVAQFTLTSQTKDVLSKLETPVDVLCFFVPDAYGIDVYATSLLAEYQNYTEQLNIKVIDPDEHPEQARQYGIIQYQTVVFERQNHLRLVSIEEIILEAEHAFTSAILEVTGIVQKKVYFLTGHREGNINTDYSSAREGLRDNLYLVETLDLTRNPSIPEDCAALIIAGPQEFLTTEEVEIIDRYLKSGGWALFLINPDSSQEIKQLLLPWDINIEDGIVIDPLSYAAPSRDITVVPRTRNALDLSRNTYFPGAAALIPQPQYTAKAIAAEETGILTGMVFTSEESQIEMFPLLWTSKASWLEKDFDPPKQPEFDEEIEHQGSLHLGFFIISAPLTGEVEGAPGETKWTRLAVIGDSDFASNQHFHNGDNGTLFVNTVNILTLGTELISIDRKVLQVRRLILSPEETRFLNYSSIGLLPIIILAMGGIIWWRRR